MHGRRRGVLAGCIWRRDVLWRDVVHSRIRDDSTFDHECTDACDLAERIGREIACSHMSSRIVATAAGQRAGEDRESNDGPTRNLAHVSTEESRVGKKSVNTFKTRGAPQP